MLLLLDPGIEEQKLPQNLSQRRQKEDEAENLIASALQPSWLFRKKELLSVVHSLPGLIRRNSSGPAMRETRSPSRALSMETCPCLKLRAFHGWSWALDACMRPSSARPSLG